MYHWLVVDGQVWHAVVSFSVGFAMAKIVTFRPLKKHRQVQEEIRNLLDTSLPGGLTDVVNAVKDAKGSSPN